MAKYYAVLSGRQTGIFTDWATTEQQVKGFPGALFKSFTSRAAAERFISSSTSIRCDESAMVVPLIDRTIIYTDGSFVKDSCGYGIVMITPNNEKIRAYGQVPLKASNNVAELYAIYVALSLVKGDVIIYSDSQYAIDCLTTYIHDWMMNGWKGIANRELLESTYEKMKDRDVLFSHVNSHCGILLNEEADKLANEGRLCGEELIIKR